MDSDQRTATIRDVARRAGVSATTASRVLSPRATPAPIAVGEASRQRILAAAADLGYRPNLLARGLRTRHTHVLGAIAADLGDPFVAEVIRAADRASRERGYSLVFSSVGSASETDLARGSLLTQSFSLVEGMLTIGVPSLGSSFAPQGTARPAVAILSEGSLSSAVTVRSDTTSAVVEALEYLYGLGHRRVGLIVNAAKLSMRPRLQAYVEFLDRHRLPSLPGYVQRESHDYGGGARAAERLLGLSEPPTAVLAANDQAAVGALNAAWRLGWRVPEDLSIVGVDDIPVARHLVPSLTTVRQPAAELGQRATGILVDLVEGRLEPSTVGSVVVRSQLVIRASACPPRPNARSPASSRTGTG